MADDNVLMFPGTQGVNIPDEDVLGPELDPKVLFDAALEHDLTNVVIAATTKEGNIYFASSSGNPEKILWELERAKYLLMLSYFADLN